MSLRFASLTFWLWLLANQSPALAQVNGGSRLEHVDPRSPSDHFAVGIAALQAGDFQLAYDHLLTDYRTAPSYRTAAVLGQAAGELGRHAEAASLLATSLRAMPSDIAPEVRKPIQDYLERMQEHVTTVVLFVSPSEASDQLEVEVDGKPVEVQAGLFLAPGKHLVLAKAPGYGPVQIQVVASPGERRREVVRFSRVALVPPASHDRAPSAQDLTDGAKTDWRLPAAIVTGGLALAGAGLGGYFLYRANDADDRMIRLQQDLASSRTLQPCAPGVRSPNACSDLNSVVEQRTNSYNAAVVTLSTAAALALSSAALWVWEMTDDTTVSATLVPHGVVLGGAF